MEPHCKEHPETKIIPPLGKKTHTGHKMERSERKANNKRRSKKATVQHPRCPNSYHTQNLEIHRQNSARKQTIPPKEAPRHMDTLTMQERGTTGLLQKPFCPNNQNDPPRNRRSMPFQRMYRNRKGQRPMEPNDQNVPENNPNERRQRKRPTRQRK